MIDDKSLNNENLSDEKIVERAQHALDESIEHLDGHTLSRLNQARQAALSANTAPSGDASWRNWQVWSPMAGACAVFMVVVYNLWSLPEGQQQALLNLASIEAIGVHATEESTLVGDQALIQDTIAFEMLQDLEFVEWLEMEEAGLNNEPLPSEGLIDEAQLDRQAKHTYSVLDLPEIKVTINVS